MKRAVDQLHAHPGVDERGTEADDQRRLAIIASCGAASVRLAAARRERC